MLSENSSETGPSKENLPTNYITNHNEAKGKIFSVLLRGDC